MRSRWEEEEEAREEAGEPREGWHERSERERERERERDARQRQRKTSSLDREEDEGCMKGNTGCRG